MKGFLFINWCLVLCGVAMVAWFLFPISWDPVFVPLIIAGNMGPYLLFGLAGHVAQKNKRIRRLCLLLLIILLAGSGWFYTFYMFLTKGSQGGFVFLTLPIYMWIYSVAAFVILVPCATESPAEDGKDN